MQWTSQRQRYSKADRLDQKRTKKEGKKEGGEGRKEAVTTSNSVTVALMQKRQEAFHDGKCNEDVPFDAQ